MNVSYLTGLAKEAKEAGLLSFETTQKGKRNPHRLFSVYSLTLAGWSQFELAVHARAPGSYGFIAMKFGDGTLDELVEKVIKPEVRRGTGYEVMLLPEFARAGVIDNLLRERIRDAAFVLVDLTHDNSGAYWEAGYAEGLGKAVIYICEEAKFAEKKTHFDTNHCTTVMWGGSDPQKFPTELVATIRRSLDLF